MTIPDLKTAVAMFDEADRDAMAMILSRVHRCATCLSIFYAAKRHYRHCSAACRNRQAQRTFAERHPQEEADRYHERYRRKLEERLPGQRTLDRRIPRKRSSAKTKPSTD